MIELMVVIAIVAVLAATAVPRYKDYVIRTRVLAGLNIAEIIAKDIKIEIARTGQLPASITVNNVTIAAEDPWTTVNIENVGAVHYGISADGLGFAVGVAMTDLQGIPNYNYQLPPTGGYSSVIYAVRDNNGVFESVCGSYAGIDGTANVPAEYLPGVCTCTDIVDYKQNGTSC